MAEFSFGQVEAVLAALNRVADHKRVAFMSRLKHLQKNGLPERDRPGRGKSASYSFDQLMQMAAGVDLLQAGLPPQLAATIVASNWSSMRFAVHVGTYTESEIKDRLEEWDQKGVSHNPEAYNDQLWMISPEALRDLSVEGVREYDQFEAVLPVPIHEASRDLLAGAASGIVGERWRTLVINGTALTRAVVNLISFQFRFELVESLRKDIQAAFDAERQRHEEMMAIIKSGTPMLSPEQAEELRARFATTEATDFSTNPPTPPELLKAQAHEMIPRLSAEAKRLLLVEPGSKVELHEATLRELVKFKLFEVADGQLEQTMLGKAVAAELTKALRETVGRTKEANDGDSQKA